MKTNFGLTRKGDTQVPGLCCWPLRCGYRNCTQARTADEVTVCHTPALNELDVQMATEYRLLRGMVAMGLAGTMADD